MKKILLATILSATSYHYSQTMKRDMSCNGDMCKPVSEKEWENLSNEITTISDKIDKTIKGLQPLQRLLATDAELTLKMEKMLEVIESVYNSKSSKDLLNLCKDIKKTADALIKTDEEILKYNFASTFGVTEEYEQGIESAKEIKQQMIQLEKEIKNQKKDN